MNRMTRGLRCRMLMLCLPLVAACGNSDPVIVDIGGVTSSLIITVDYLEAGQRPGVADQLQLAVGDSVRLSATGVNALGLVVGAPAVTWSSSNVAILNVTSQGLVKAVSPGSAEITASVDQASARLPGSVTDEAPSP